MNRAIFIGCAAWVLLSAVAAQGFETRYAEIPSFDGRWDSIPFLAGDFIYTQTPGRDGQPVTENRTRVKVAHDDMHLYVKAICDEENMPGVITAHSGAAIWQNDCFEVFIDAARDREHMAQFIVSVDGQTHGWDRSRRQTSEWTGLARRFDDRWEAEFRIPFATLGLVPERGRVLRASFGRERRAGLPPGRHGRREEFSTWTPPRGFSQLDDYGVLVLGTFQDALRLHAGQVRRMAQRAQGSLLQITDEEWAALAADGEALAAEEAATHAAFIAWWSRFEEVYRQVRLVGIDINIQ